MRIDIGHTTFKVCYYNSILNNFFLIKYRLSILLYPRTRQFYGTAGRHQPGHPTTPAVLSTLSSEPVRFKPGTVRIHKLRRRSLGILCTAMRNTLLSGVINGKKNSCNGVRNISYIGPCINHSFCYVYVLCLVRGICVALPVSNVFYQKADRVHSLIYRMMHALHP